MEIKEKLAEILKEYRGEGLNIQDGTTFDELGFDSLDKVELLMKIEEEYNIVFDDDLQIETVGQLVGKIQSLLK